MVGTEENKAKDWTEKHEAARNDALAGFLDLGPSHKNCAQSVVFYSLRMLEGDPDTIGVARYLGGGVARLGLVCGALTGAAVSLGLRDLRDPFSAERSREVMAQLQALVRDFAKEFNGTACLDLTGYDISTNEGLTRFVQETKLERCALYVGWACDRLSDLLYTGE